MDSANPEKHAYAVRSLLHELVGDMDTTGIELVRLIRMVANQYESAVDGHLGADGLSGPRWALLLRLLAEERCSAQGSASPTRLSHSQNVSKNTISALLRGLEEQGLIERTLDPDDKRAFRIRLTEAGRQLVQATAPGHIAYLNDLVSALTAEERAQLTALLVKLHRSPPMRGRLSVDGLRPTEDEQRPWPRKS
jgi:DNA-binding MarR family transcriptional regulator